MECGDCTVDASHCIMLVMAALPFEMPAAASCTAFCWDRSQATASGCHMYLAVPGLEAIYNVPKMYGEWQACLLPVVNCSSQCYQAVAVEPWDPME